MKNLFAMLRDRAQPVLSKHDDDSEFDMDLPVPNIFAPIFEATHRHVRTGKEYMVTSDGDRLEVTGDDAYPLVEYEDSEGKQFAQRADRFHDGRFLEIE